MRPVSSDLSAKRTEFARKATTHIAAKAATAIGQEPGVTAAPRGDWVLISFAATGTGEAEDLRARWSALWLKELMR